MEIAQTTVTRPRAGSSGAALDFLQLRAQYHVSGRVGDKVFEFSAPGSAETFRGR
jgi:hypothetical protein